MILPLLLLLASLLQQYGTEAESSHVSKLHIPAVKEQNGECSIGFFFLKKKEPKEYFGGKMHIFLMDGNSRVSE